MKSHKKTIYEALGRDPVHPFPARMAPGIALDVVATPKKRMRVLDPMMGSGTVLALARASGHTAIGVDIDPLAVLLAKVWTTAVDKAKVRQSARILLERARSALTSTPTRLAYPPNADEETREFVRYWFDRRARRELACLACAIRKVRSLPTRNVLWCAFSRLIITKQAGASLAMDLAHSRPHKKFQKAPVRPFERFLLSVEQVLKNCLSKSDNERGRAPIIKHGDARRLMLKSKSVDLVVTSPPYLNAIDYMRCSKFSLIWMGRTTKELRAIRSLSVGTEVGKKGLATDNYIAELISKLRIPKSLSKRHVAILGKFIEDMHSAISEVSRVLVPGGKAIYVVGENTVAGTYIRNSQIVRAAAQRAGLRFQKQTVRRLPRNRRYLPPPMRRQTSVAMDGRMRREVILSFRKPRA